MNDVALIRERTAHATHSRTSDQSGRCVEAALARVKADCIASGAPITAFDTSQTARGAAREA